MQDELIYNQHDLKIFKRAIRLNGHDGFKLYCHIEEGAYREINMITQEGESMGDQDKTQLNILLHSISDHFKDKNREKVRTYYSGETKKVKYIFHQGKWQWVPVDKIVNT